MKFEFNITVQKKRKRSRSENFLLFKMTMDKVQAKINVKSENFEQVLEEPVVDSTTTKSYDELIAANERLRLGISKIFTEFVNKARLEQEANGDSEKKKRKLKRNENEFLFYSKKLELSFFFK